MLRLDMFMVHVFVIDVFTLDVFMLAVSSIMFGVFLSHVGGEFRPVGSATGFNFLDFFFG